MTEPPAPPLTVDAHVHVWDLARRQLPWLPAGHPLRRDYLVEDLREASGGVVPECVLVQADADPAEVHDLLALAEEHPEVLGVVGWFDLREDLTAQFAALADRLVGVRCPPADQHDPSAFTDPAFVRGVQAAAQADLAVDLLLRPSALPGAAQLAAAVPDARLVIDHLGNPPGEAWADGMKALADTGNVVVKLSGAYLPPDDLAAHIDFLLGLLGSDRLMFGSDWPVCTLRSSRAETIRLFTTLVPPAAHDDVFGGTARRTYSHPARRQGAPCPTTPGARSSRPPAPPQALL
ncbi:amidohydrolase family protein [Kribbella endophytica]